jgi:hypothetical protein
MKEKKNQEARQHEAGLAPHESTQQSATAFYNSPPAVNPLTLPMAHQLPKRDVFNAVLTGVARAFADLNVKDISEQDRDYLVNELADNIIKHYPAIRLPEIALAFWLGVRGTFGEFFGLSVVTFERFIHNYLLSEKRTQLVKDMPAPDEKQVPDMETQFATAKHNALQALQRKKDGKET